MTIILITVDKFNGINDECLYYINNNNKTKIKRLIIR